MNKITNDDGTTISSEGTVRDESGNVIHTGMKGVRILKGNGVTITGDYSMALGCVDCNIDGPFSVLVNCKNLDIAAPGAFFVDNKPVDLLVAERAVRKWALDNPKHRESALLGWRLSGGGGDVVHNATDNLTK